MSDATTLPKDFTGPVSADEARDALQRFVVSHWDAGRPSTREKARFTIPCDPKRDDDIRLGAYIDQSEASIRELEAENDRLKFGAIEEIKKNMPLRIEYNSLEGGEFVYASPAWGVLSAMIADAFQEAGNPANFLETPFEFELNGRRSPRFTITIRKNDGKSPAELLSEARAELAAIKAAAGDEDPIALVAAAKKLPITADGVRVGPSEIVYTGQGSEWQVRDSEYASESWTDGDPSAPISECYSTREAAEAARKRGMA